MWASIIAMSVSIKDRVSCCKEIDKHERVGNETRTSTKQSRPPGGKLYSLETVATCDLRRLTNVASDSEVDELRRRRRTLSDELDLLSECSGSGEPEDRDCCSPLVGSGKLGLEVWGLPLKRLGWLGGGGSKAALVRKRLRVLMDHSESEN